MLRLKIHEWLVFFVMIAAIAGFFMPWAKINFLPSLALERMAEKVAHDLGSKNDFYLKDFFVMKKYELRAANADLWKGMSGFQLPAIVNKRNTDGLMANLALQALFGHKGTEQKALLVYAYPLIVVASFLMLISVQKNRRLLLIPSVLALVFYFWTRYRIITTELERSVLQLQIGWGLWICLYSLLVTGILMFLFAFAPARLMGGAGKKSKGKVKSTTENDEATPRKKKK